MADETLTLDPAPPAPTPSDWRANLPEDLRAEKSLESFKDVGALAKSWVNAQKLIGEKVPEGLTPETVTEYLKRRAEGPPETADKYSIKAPTFPESLGITWDKAAETGFLAAMHAAGLNNAQVQTALDWYGKYVLHAHDQQKHQWAEEDKATTAALRAAWGTAYDRNRGLANEAIRRLADGDPKLLAAASDETGNPNFMRLMYLVGEMMVERGEVRGDQHHAGRSLDEIRAELARIRTESVKNPNVDVTDKILALTREELLQMDRSK